MRVLVALALLLSVACTTPPRPPLPPAIPKEFSAAVGESDKPPAWLLPAEGVLKETVDRWKALSPQERVAWARPIYDRRLKEHREHYAQIFGEESQYATLEIYLRMIAVIADGEAAAAWLKQQGLDTQGRPLPQGPAQPDLGQVFRDIAKPRQPVAAADKALAEELYRSGSKRARALTAPVAKMNTNPKAIQVMRVFAACSFAIAELGVRYPRVDPAQAEQVFRQLWWRAFEAAGKALGVGFNFPSQLASNLPVGYYQWTQQAAKLVPFHKAQVRLGEAQGDATQRFKGNAGLAAYAYTIGQAEAFDHYAGLALELAVEVCNAKGPGVFISASMREHGSPEFLARLEAMQDTSKSQSDSKLFPDLGILARQLGDRQRTGPLRRFARVVQGSRVSGRLRNQIALAVGGAGLAGAARRLAKSASAAYREQIVRTSAFSSDPGMGGAVGHLEARAAVEAKLVGQLLAHYRGERPKPWSVMVQLCPELRAAGGMDSRGQALAADWPALKGAYALTISSERVLGQAQPFLLERYLEASPLIETLEESDTNLAIALYLVGVSSQEGKREGISIQDRAKLFDALKNRTLYRGLLRTLARRGEAGDADRAWAISELSRARQLKELLASDTSREVASLTQPLELAKRLRARLKPDQALVGYHLLPKHLLVLTLTQAKSGAVLIPLDTRAFSARVSGLHEALANPRATDVGSRLLAVGRVLLRPVAKLLAGKKQLFVLPDGVLHTVPFDVLPGPGGRPLLESLAVTVLPSAETLLRAPRKAAAEARLFALADPVYPKLSTAAGSGALDVAQAKTRGAKGIPALPETRTEVTAIGGLFKEKTILLGADARESTVKGRDLRAFSHVHFATHGVLAYELPNVTEPALILSRESGEDAFLTASEARRLKLNADVCVLSACNTGSGKVLNGEGVLGLSRAFLLAGSRAVLVSLWPVASEATKDLMIRFYKHVNAGKPKAEALRLAKLELARRGAKGGGTRGFGGIVSGKPTTPVDAKGDGRHPFFWAPFVLVGGE